MVKIKCAVYVRKSTEKGLELEFNSLHNQEEACKNYILSQAFQGWEFAKTYVDGGISGGTMERPALKQMLDDMSRGLVNVVVVYKVDRLSRSIMDFHNMMKTFDKYNCNFVSITQSFDTSNSMGKLTLNMLLSFAQFEREVSSERVRDKIRASRAKGIWTGGVPFLGYDCIDKKLVVNELEAEQIKSIFELYLELGSVADLAIELRTRGIINKRWTTANGTSRGGAPISTTSLHRLLREKIYTGYIEHKKTGTNAKGEHDAILTQELFDAVQEKLKNNSNGKSGRSSRAPNLLSGKLYDANGIKFTNNQSKKNNNKPPIYYYALAKNYIRTNDIDTVAVDAVREFLNADLSSLSNDIAHNLKQINYDGLGFAGQREFIRTIIDRAVLTTSDIAGKLTIFIKPDPVLLNQFIAPEFINQNINPMKFIISNGTVIIEREIVITKGNQLTKYNTGHSGLMTMTENNHLLLKAFVIAFRYRETFETLGSYEDVLRTEKTSWRSLYRYMNLAYMHPNKINAIMSGREQYGIEELFNIAPQFQL